jgi:hypothetical protein
MINSFIYFSYFSYFLAYREVMSNGQGSSPQAEAIQKKMDALMTRYLTMKAALLVQSAIDNSMLLCAASGSWMVQLALSLDQVCFQNGSQGGRNREAGGRTPSQILADQLTLCQPWGGRL